MAATWRARPPLERVRVRVGVGVVVALVLACSLSLLHVDLVAWLCPVGRRLRSSGLNAHPDGAAAHVEVALAGALSVWTGS
jgi:hypothetical protein